MQNRIILPLLIAASVAFARGSFAGNDNKTLASRTHGSAKNEVLATTFDVSRPTGEAESLRFALRVVNNTSKMVEINFPDGQTHDFVVNDSTGKEIWRWSEGRMFTQAIQTKLLGTGETVKYQDEWDTTLAAGKYIAVAKLSSDEELEQRVEFEVR